LQIADMVYTVRAVRSIWVVPHGESKTIKGLEKVSEENKKENRQVEVATAEDPQGGHKRAEQEMQEVIARVGSGNLELTVRPKTIELLAQIKKASEEAYEVQRLRLRGANSKVSLQTIDRLVKARSTPGTHNTYAQAMLKALTVDGHAPVTHDSTLYVLNADTKIWESRQAIELVPRITRAFDGATHCMRAPDYAAVAQLTIDSAADPRFFADAAVGLACLDEFHSVSGDEVTCHPLTPDHRQRVRLEFKPRNEVTPLFDDFLHRTFKSVQEGEETAQVRLLQEIAGAIMTGVMHRFHKAALFYDPYGRAGKGTLERILRKLVPSEFVTAVSPTRWNKEYYLMQLKDARLNTVGELSEAERIPADYFKTVIGGDVLTGRHAYGRPVSFRNEAAHLFMSNSLPAANEHGDAFFSRWLILEFPNSLLKSGGSIDPTLADRIIENEMPGIAHWALEGARRLLEQRKFSSSAVHDRLIAASRRANSSVEEFIHEECELNADKWIKRAELYTMYRDWCMDANKKPVSKGRFKMTLENAAPLGISWAKLNGYEIFRGVDRKGMEDGYIDPDF
jgi:P4 family phage/plasmid primase-like protien